MLIKLINLLLVTFFIFRFDFILDLPDIPLELAVILMPHRLMGMRHSIKSHLHAKRGTVEEGAARDFSHVVHPGWCYKVVAVGGEGIEDLDLRVYDADSVLVERDTTEDPRPFLGSARPICPVESATYRIEVRAASGGGDFAVQVYRSL